MKTKINYLEKLLREQEKLLHDVLRTSLIALEGTGSHRMIGAHEYSLRLQPV